MVEAKLTVIEGPLKGKDFLLGRENSLGRLPENDIAIEEGTISRQHAGIRLEGDRFFLTDLGSQNGTLVNASRVKEVELKDGDEISMGSSVFRFEQKGRVKEEGTVMLAKKGRGEETRLEKPDETVFLRAKPQEKTEFDLERFFQERVLERPLVLATLGVLFVLLTLSLFLPLGWPPEDPAKIGEDKEEIGPAALTPEEILSRIEDPEILKEKAEESLSLGKSLYARRRVKCDNLFKAIKRFEEAIGLMWGLDPKPDIYSEAVASLEEAKETLDKEFRNARFRVERAIKLGEYEEASNEAKAIMEMIPDRKDERYQYAERRYGQLRRFLSRRRR